MSKPGSFQWYTVTGPEAMELRRFPLNTSKHLCMVRERSPGMSCPERLWGVSSSEIFRSCQDVVLGTLLWVFLLEQGPPEGPAGLSQPVNL